MDKPKTAMEAMQITNTADTIRLQLARAFAYELRDNVLPLFSALEPNEQLAALIVEADKLMRQHDSFLTDACKRFEKIATDAINCSVVRTMVKP